MDGQRSGSDRLPVWATLGEAALAVTKNWEVLLKAIAVPAMIVAAVNVFFQGGQQEPSILMLPLMVLSGAFGMMIAVSCHRFVLLGQDALPSPWGVYWTSRETRFLGWWMGISLISMGLTMLLVLVLGVLATGIFLATGGAAGSLPDPGVGVNVFLAGAGLGIAFVFPMIYIMARLSLVLPATAIGERPTLKGTWQLSRSNGWRLALVMFLPSLFLVPLSLWGLTLLDGNLLSRFIWAFMLTVLAVIGIAALSKSFSFLRPDSPDEED